MTGAGAHEVPSGASREDVAEVPASSVILLRGEPLEILLMRRNDRGTFVPGAWVFPGGALDHADRQVASAGPCVEGDPELNAMKLCGMRETLEEVGVWLGDASIDPRELRVRLSEGCPLECAQVAPGLDALVLTSRWVTPEGLPRRYDTWFFLAGAPAGCRPEVDGGEGVELRWISPAGALDAHRRGEMKLVFPTIRNLESLTRYASPRAALVDRRGSHITVQRPLLRREGGRTRITLPGEE